MNQQEKKNLFFQLLQCKGEKEVKKIVESNKYLKNQDNWYPYGGRDKEDRANFGIFSNQQAKSGPALIEKITNSIDALLLKKCKQRNIEPKSNNAPKSINEAAEKFFNIKNGDIRDLQGKTKAVFAKENIQILALDSDINNDLVMDLLIWDNGEGQYPKDFPKTFLSLQQNNKSDIHFVQGKYNFGSTGAVRFCGKHKYQLICSKKNEKIFELDKNEKNNYFGWTLVRQHPLDEWEKKISRYTWYEYFSLNGEEIPNFDEQEINLELDGNIKFQSGSFIKLYSYEIPPTTQKIPIWQGLYREFNQLFYNPALPFWLVEKRKKFKHIKRSESICVSGNHNRLLENESITEKRIPIKTQKNKEIGEINIQVFVLKSTNNTDKGKQQWRDIKRNYIGKKHLILTVNGQVHGHFSKTFITKELNFPFLNDCLLIVVDCSKMTVEYSQEIFMANRTHFADNSYMEKLKNWIIDELKNDKNLKHLNKQREEEARLSVGKDEKEIKKEIEQILTKIDEQNENKLGEGNNPPKNIPSKAGTNNIKLPNLKKFPSFLKLKKKFISHGNTKVIPINKAGKFEFETDVQNDYFDRIPDNGEIKMYLVDGWETNEGDGGDKFGDEDKITDYFETRKNSPDNGTIGVTLTPDKKVVKVGDEFKIKFQLTSIEESLLTDKNDLTVILNIKIADPVNDIKKPKEKKKNTVVNFPEIIKVKFHDGEWIYANEDELKEGSPNVNMKENDVVDIKTKEINNNSRIINFIYINIESPNLQNRLYSEKRKNKNTLEKIKNAYIKEVCLHVYFLFNIIEKIEKNSKNKNFFSEEFTVEELIQKIFRKYDGCLLNLKTISEIFRKTLED